MKSSQIEYLTTRSLQHVTHSVSAPRDVLIVMPFTQPSHAQMALQLMAKRAQVPVLLVGVHDEDGWGFIRIVNHVFRLSQSRYFGYVAQDAFAGRSWLAMALSALGDGGALLGFNDGKWAGALAGFGLAQRQWAAQNYHGDFFYPKYRRHYADAELTVLAMQARRYVYEPNSVLVEIDWHKDQSAVDRADRALFLQRRALGFDNKVTHPQLLTLFS